MNLVISCRYGTFAVEAIDIFGMAETARRLRNYFPADALILPFRGDDQEWVTDDFKYRLAFDDVGLHWVK
ncbi:MAG TPA: hypothetical protein VN828_15745 [Acidobacteriaceae bacterium]|nr:hypothetical protein [Acidobacteriaceae bacterium]